MGKKRHTQDKLWITSTEHREDWGGKKISTSNAKKFQKPLFYCCALSFLPFKTPVATSDGTIFEFTNIVPYIQKYKRNPVNGEAIKLTDLIKLKFHKNDKNEYYCPVTKKVFNEYSHIIAIKETGNVYSYEAYEELNKKLDSYNDLLTDEPFNPKNVIVLQNPKAPDRNINDFFYVKNGDEVNFEDKTETTMNLTNSQKKLIDKIQKEGGQLKPETEYQNLQKRIKTQEGEEEDKEEKKQPQKPAQPRMFVNPLKLKNPQPKDFRLDPKAYIQLKKIEEKNRHSAHTEGKTASSFTSTSLTPVLTNEFRQKSDEEIRKEYYQLIKSRQLKGKVEFSTTFGKLVLNLHCDYAPKTCENFIELCESGYYNDTIFHRLIPNFMIQGGDPKGTGTGGTSYFGKNFEDEFHPKLAHTKRGVLSMANSGSNTNGSQFFITFGPTTHLDGKHSVFGELVDGKETLDILENIPTGENDRPVKKIKIVDTVVHTNPYRDTIQQLLSKQFASEKKEREEKIGGTWTSFKDKDKKPAFDSSASTIGKYMKKP